MERVNELTKDCFNVLLQLETGSTNNQVVPEVVYRQMTELIDAMGHRAKQLGFSPKDADDIAYALVALADEVAMRKSGPIRDYWMSRPLQLHYFGENVAGEGFFVRLEALLNTPSRAETLRVYYLALLFGFQGKYAGPGQEAQLHMVQRRTRDALASSLRPEPLSKRHLRPKEPRRNNNSGVLAVWIAAFSFLFTLCLVIALKIAIDARADEVVNRANAMVEK